MTQQEQPKRPEFYLYGLCLLAIFILLFFGKINIDIELLGKIIIKIFGNH